MVKVLFVDDEVNVLNGLKRSLRSLRHQWQSEFAEGGVAALDLLEKASFDVVVTDMRMPGMDGVTLLEKIAGRYPDTVRIVLSGQSDMESVVKAAGITHQYLSKPCPIETLKSTVSRAVSLRQMVRSAALVEVVSKLDTIPSAPPLYLELIRLLDSQSTTLSDIGQLIAKDMGMCAKVLQLANSPFFGRNYSVSDPGEAAGLLGFNLLKTLAVASHVFKKFEPVSVKGFDVDALWAHSLKTSHCAEKIAKTLAPDDKDVPKRAQVAGLLHDVGQLLIACNLPTEYERVMALSQQRDVDLTETEWEVLGITHAEMGAYVLGLWGLPDEVVEAVLHHHNLDVAPTPPCIVSIAVHVADALTSGSVQGPQPPDHPVLKLKYLEELGAAEHMENWREACLNTPQ